MEMSDGYDKQQYLFFPIQKKKIAIKLEKLVSYAGFHGANASNNFVGIQYIKNEKGRTVKGNICLFDSALCVIDTIYKCKDNELASSPFLSRDDKYLLFFTENSTEDEQNPLALLNPVMSVVIMDFKKREILRRIENIANSLSIDVFESPWLQGEERFIVSIKNDRKIRIAGKPDQNESSFISGLYVFDVQSGDNRLLIEDATNGIVSPVEDKIAYIKDEKIWIYDFNQDKTTSLFTLKINEQEIRGMHWTPDGQNIYFAHYIDQPLGLFDSDEKLIRVKDGKSMKFKKLSHGFGHYTWR